MNIFFQQVLNGLTLGSVYALVALGLTLVYGILHIPNFAHGALYMVGAYVAFYLARTAGLNYWAAMAGAAAAVAVLAVLSDRLIFHQLRHAPPLHDMIAAIGLLLFLEAVIQAIWGRSSTVSRHPILRSSGLRPGRAHAAPHHHRGGFRADGAAARLSHPHHGQVHHHRDGAEPRGVPRPSESTPPRYRC